MSTRNTLTSLLLGCSVLVLASQEASVAQTRFPQINVVAGGGLKGIPFEFIITDSTGKQLCAKTGMKLSIATPAVPCANLVPLKTSAKLKITIGPEANLKCAPKSKPIEFNYVYPQDIVIVVKNIKTCDVQSR